MLLWIVTVIKIVTRVKDKGTRMTIVITYGRGRKMAVIIEREEEHLRNGSAGVARA